jgi:Tol biopolymer transport system component
MDFRKKTVQIALILMVASLMAVMNGSSGANPVTATATSDPILLTTDGWNPAWSPDGTKIVFHNSPGYPDNIFVIGADGTNRQQLTYNTGYDSFRQPKWSPDGTMITFWAYKPFGQGGSIWTMNADGSNQTKLYVRSGYDSDKPTFSPDGTKIVFTSCRRYGGRPRELYMMSPDGSNVVKILNALGDKHDGMRKAGGSVSFSPDGQWIAFESERAGNWDIWVVRPDGSDLTQLTTELSTDFYPAWSPDGSQIAFTSDRSENNDIWILTNVQEVISGGAPNYAQVTTDSSDDRYPAWSPNGSKIAFNSDRSGTWDIWVAPVGPANQPPVASFTYSPADPVVNQTITFDASASDDPDGSIVSYEWDWESDGIYDDSTIPPTTTIEHSFDSAGDHIVTLRVTDNQGATGISTKTVSVGAQPTELILPVPYFYQGTTNWCVLNGLAMVLQYYGKPVHAWDIAQEWQQEHDEMAPVCHWWDLVLKDKVDPYLQRWGLHARWSKYRCLPHEHLDLDFEEDFVIPLTNSTPLIIWGPPKFERCKKKATFHFVVVVGYEIHNDSRYLYVHDPSGCSWEGEGFLSDSFVKVPWTDFEALHKEGPGGILLIDGEPDPPKGVIWVTDEGISHFVKDPEGEDIIESYLYLDKGLVYLTDKELSIPGFLLPEGRANWLRWLRNPVEDPEGGTWKEKDSALDLTIQAFNPGKEAIECTIEVSDEETSAIHKSSALLQPKRMYYFSMSLPLNDLGIGEHSLRITLKSCQSNVLLSNFDASQKGTDAEDEIGPIEFEIVVPSLMEGDVNGDGKIDIKDAEGAAEFALGLTTLTQLQQEAADVVLPPGIDARDVVRIAEVALGIRSGFGSEGSGQATPAQGKALGEAKLSIESGELAPNGTVRISATPAISGIQVGPQGSLSFDPHVIQIKEIRGIPPFQVLASEIDNQAGSAKFMAIALGEPRSGAIIELEVEPVGREGESTVIRLVPDMVLDAQGNELDVEIAEGRLTIGRAVPLKIERILSVPNPARSGDGMRFVVEGQGIRDIQVQIYDLSGREIFSSGWAENGLTWFLRNNGGRLVANGIYLYIVTVRGFNGELVQSQVKKLVVLR